MIIFEFNRTGGSKNNKIDFLTKVHKKNEVEVSQYYVKDSHESIVSKVCKFDKIEKEMNESLARKKQNNKRI